MSRALIVDDDPSMCAMLAQGLEVTGVASETSHSVRDAIQRLAQKSFDVVITDVRMRGENGLSLCQRITELRLGVPVIVVTAFGSMEVAIEAMRAGAYDFITKPFELDTLRETVRRALSSRRGGSVPPPPGEGPRVGARAMLGQSPCMLELFDMIRRVGPSAAAVLISGESGTGKELVAQEVHASGRQANGPFVAVNCAAIPGSLLESELFGHEKGAFTDARSQRVGLFQQANGGTLFLDEIGELPLEVQPKLLRALQERTVRPVGAKQEIPFHARLITATNRDLEAQVAAGSFREDLYYRIQVVRLDVPPLRERREDILLLAQAFIEELSETLDSSVRGMHPAVVQRLMEHPWPGNVRELRNCIERAVTMCRGIELTVEDLPRNLSGIRTTRPPPPETVPADAMASMEEIERQHVLRVFEATGRNKSLAAKILSLNRKTLYRKLRRYGAIPPESDVGFDS